MTDGNYSFVSCYRNPSPQGEALYIRSTVSEADVRSIVATAHDGDRPAISGPPQAVLLLDDSLTAEQGRAILNEIGSSGLIDVLVDQQRDSAAALHREIDRLSPEQVIRVRRLIAALTIYRDSSPAA